MVTATTVRHIPSTPSTLRARPLGRRAQMFARGPGWILGEGHPGTWTLRIGRDGDDMRDVWTDALRAARSIADAHGLGPLIIDLRHSPRLASDAAEVAGQLFAEFERRSVRLAIVVGPDLIHAARVHRLLGMHAPVLGRCFLTEDEGLDWVGHGMWPMPSAPVMARPWTRSRPHVVASSLAAQR